MNLMRPVIKVIIFNLVSVGGGGAFEFDLNWVLTSNGYCLKYFHNIPFFKYVKKNFCSLCIDHLINLHLFKHELGNSTCKQFNRKNNHSDLKKNE